MANARHRRHTKNRALRGALAAGVTTAIIGRKLARNPTWIPERIRGNWMRENHRNETVTLHEGPALAVGLAAGAVCAASSARTAGAAAIAITGAGAFGVIDDLAETTTEKGLRGHVGALLRGKLTTGGLKILGIGASALTAAAITRGAPGSRSGAGSGQHNLRGLADVLADGALIAASANLANLFDLRPGRVLKVSTAAALPLALGSKESGIAGAVVGASLAAAPGDLLEETMAGDGGANALGAALGAAVSFAAPRWARNAALVGVAALTVASEKWSFSEFIESRPRLRALDSWGRRR